MTPLVNGVIERWAQIQMMQLRYQQIMSEGRSCTDPERLKTLDAELGLIYDGLVEIRQQQILEELERAAPKRKRRWWRLGR